MYTVSLGHTSVGYSSLGHTSKKLKNPKFLTGLTCVKKENYRYAQKLNLEVKQSFVEA